MSEIKVKDGGSRKTYSTGAQKEDQGETLEKGRFDLLPPQPIMELAKIYSVGACKYSSRNWQLGIPLSRFLDSAMRHLFQFIEGREDENHLHQCLWNIVGLSYTQDMIRKGLLPEELNDLPCYMPIDGEDDEWRKENRLLEGYLNGKEKE